jgi:hypothetical protein
VNFLVEKLKTPLCLTPDINFYFFSIIIKFSIKPLSQTLRDPDLGRDLRLGTTDLDCNMLIYDYNHILLFQGEKRKIRYRAVVSVTLYVIKLYNKMSCDNPRPRGRPQHCLPWLPHLTGHLQPNRLAANR